MRPKVIEKDRLRVKDDNEQQKARLSYEMVFVDKEEVDEDVSRAVERVNTEWEHRLINEKQKAVDQGYAAGFEDGMQKAREEIDTHLGTFNQALDDLEGYLTETISALKPAVNALVFDLAEKVIGVPVESEALREKVFGQIEQFLKQLDDDHKAVITVSEQDYDSVQHLKEKADHLRHIAIERDAGLNPGEYRVESNHGVLLNDFKKTLTDFRNSSKLDDWIND